MEPHHNNHHLYLRHPLSGLSGRPTVVLTGRDACGCMSHTTDNIDAESGSPPSNSKYEPAPSAAILTARGSRHETFGQLVRLGFDVTVFTPASYQRRSLRRPSWSSNLVDGFALRCFQRLSYPDSDTQRCTWRHNWQTGGLSNTVLSY